MRERTTDLVQVRHQECVQGCDMLLLFPRSCSYLANGSYLGLMVLVAVDIKWSRWKSADVSEEYVCLNMLCCLPILCCFFAWIVLRTWRRRPHFPPKHRLAYNEYTLLHRGADKSLAFLIFLFAAQPKEFFLDGLKKLEQRSHKCVELRGEYVEWIYFFNLVACCFLYKAKDLSAAPRTSQKTELFKEQTVELHIDNYLRLNN
jgi:hypothetical protein